MSKIIILIWLHFIADFLLQSDEMALNKSKNIYWLIFHGFVYGLPFLYFGWLFSLSAFIGHVCVDGITSQLTSYFLQKEKRHWFFVTIGFDQVIHITYLILLLRRLQ